MIVLLASLNRKGQRYLREEGVRIDAGEVGARVEPQLVVSALQSLGAKVFHPPVSISGARRNLDPCLAVAGVKLDGDTSSRFPGCGIQNVETLMRSSLLRAATLRFPAAAGRL